MNAKDRLAKACQVDLYAEEQKRLEEKRKRDYVAPVVVYNHQLGMRDYSSSAKDVNGTYKDGSRDPLPILDTRLDQILKEMKDQSSEIVRLTKLVLLLEFKVDNMMREREAEKLELAAVKKVVGRISVPPKIVVSELDYEQKHE